MVKVKLSVFIKLKKVEFENLNRIMYYVCIPAGKKVIESSNTSNYVIFSKFFNKSAKEKVARFYNKIFRLKESKWVNFAAV